MKIDASNPNVKMMRVALMAMGLGLAAGIGVMPAQTNAPLEKPPLPSGRLLNKPADFSCWQMDYVYDSDQKKPAVSNALPSGVRPGVISNAPPRQVVLTLTKPLWHAAVLTLDKQRIDEWSDGVVPYFRADGIPGAMQVPVNTGGGAILPNYGAIGFPDMGWVSAASYAGVQAIKGHMCLVFEKDDMTAWINLETRDPVQWRRGGETRTFTQLAKPAGMLELPPDVANLSEANKRRLKILMTPSPKGG